MSIAPRLCSVLVCAAGLGACTGSEKSPAETGVGEDGGDDGQPADDGGADDVPTDPCGDAGQLEVGTGASAFEPFPEPPSALMVHGPQGGWHMLGSLRAVGLQQIIVVQYTITDVASGITVADNAYRVGMLYDADTCTGSYPGMYGYLNVSGMMSGELDTPPELLAWAPVEMCISADDGERSARSCVTVEAVPDPMDVDSGLAPPRPG